MATSANVCRAITDPIDQAGPRHDARPICSSVGAVTREDGFRRSRDESETCANADTLEPSLGQRVGGMNQIRPSSDASVESTIERDVRNNASSGLPPSWRPSSSCISRYLVEGGGGGGDARRAAFAARRSAPYA